MITVLFFQLLFKMFHDKNPKTETKENYLGLKCPGVTPPVELDARCWTSTGGGWPARAHGVRVRRALRGA